MAEQEWLRSGAEQLAQRGDYCGALQLLNQLLSQHPGDLHDFRLRGKCLRALELHQKAEQNEQNIQHLDPANCSPDKLFLGYLARQQYSHAVEMFTDRDPPLRDSFAHWAASEAQPSALERMLEIFLDLKRQVGDDHRILFALGHLYLGLQRFNEAEMEFRRILRTDINHEAAMMGLGRVCQIKGQSRDAILAFNRVLYLNPGQATAQERLGELFQQQRLVTDAIKYYLLAAQGYLESAQNERAIRVYQIVLGLDPSNPQACRQLTNLGAELIGITPDP